MTVWELESRMSVQEMADWAAYIWQYELGHKIMTQDEIHKALQGWGRGLAMMGMVKHGTD